jgi:hypothetical protein
MRKMSAVSMLLLLGAGMLACNAVKQAGSTPPSTSMMAGSWVTTISNFIGGRTDTVTVVNLSPNGTTVYDVSPVGVISCANGGIAYASGDGPQPAGNSVVGPACFVALGGGCNGGCVDGASNTGVNIKSSNGSGSAGSNGVEPLTFTIGVPTNPAPNGSTFNIQYAEADNATVWQMDGTGTVNNGTASGTWVCDPSTPACSGITGTFTATQQ